MSSTLSSSESFHVGGTTLESLLSKSENPVLAKFVAPHCSSCVTLKPILEQLVDQYSGQIDLVEVDMTEDPAVAIDHDIRSAPTLILFKQGQEIERIVGLKPKKKYTELVQKGLAN